MAIKRGSTSTGMRNNKLIYAIALLLFALVFTGVLMVLQKVFEKETYYVLSTDVPTRTQVTPDMLSPIVTSKDTAPINAKTVGDVQSGAIFTKFPLIKGDILTDSNTGALEDIATGVPDSWVVTTISVGADDAVGGRIVRGYYFDLMVATADGSYYPFVNMLTLDTSVPMSGASNADAVNNEEAKQGQTTQYTVAGTPADMAKLQQIMKKSGGDIKLVLSPRQNQYQAPQLAEYQNGGQKFKYDISDGPKDLGKGTDGTFTPVKRDAFGRPTEQVANCSKGNGKVDPSLCAKQGSTPSETTTPTTPAN